MNPIAFPQVNLDLGAGQPEYRTLPVHFDRSKPERTMTGLFELTEEELAKLNQTRQLWYSQLTFGNLFQPIRISVDSPFENDEAAEPPLAEPDPAENLQDYTKYVSPELIVKINQSIGAAAMCWSKTPKGVFDSQGATLIAIDIVNAVGKALKQAQETKF